jgi:hypothetical protein
MLADTNRRALGASLPWLSLGLAAMLAAFGARALFALSYFSKWIDRAAVANSARIGELVGAAIFLIGLLILARGRIAGRLSFWALSAAILWVGQMGLELIAFGGRSDLDAMRLFFAAGTGIGLSSAVPWMLDRSQSRDRLAIWRSARAVFALQLALLFVVPLVALLRKRAWNENAASLFVDEPMLLAIAWLAFAGPWTVAFIALRRTARWSQRRETLGDLLRGSGR